MSQLERTSSGIKTLPLTEAQREIWYGAQMSEGAACSFNQSGVINLRGPLDLPRLERAWRRLVQRHEALRATFSSGGETQQLHPEMSVKMAVADLSALNAEARREKLERLLQEDSSRPFDLAVGPLFRAGVVKLGAEEHVLMLTLHHIICDGCSLGILAYELGEGYAAEAGPGWEPEPLETTYSQFVLEQDASLRTPERAAAETFWLEEYSRPAPALELPADHNRPAKKSFTGGSTSLSLSAPLTQSLRQFSARRRCTLMACLLAGYYELLHRLSGQAEVIVGLPMTSRSGDTGERLVGHCVNFLPLRLKIGEKAGFAEHLDRVWRMLVSAHEHQTFTLGALLPKLNLPREINRMPLASVMFNLDWSQESAKFAGLDADFQPNPWARARFDLSLSVMERKGQLRLHAHYSAELFEKETIQQRLAHYEALLTALLAKPEQPMSGQGPFLPAAPPRPVSPRPEPEPVAVLETSEPFTPTEVALADIWREVIGLEEVRRNENFFEAGGHSLLATLVVSRIAKAFNVELPLRVIFEAPTLVELAQAITRAQIEQPGGASSIPRREIETGASELLERLDTMSEEELEELLQNPKFREVLS